MTTLVLVAALLAQDAAPEKFLEVEAGRKIPLTFLKGVSTKTASVGDQVYLETLFPITAGGRIAIPRGSYVTGSVLEVKRAGKVKGKAELRVRLETLILPNGSSRELRGILGGADSATGETVDKEGKVTGPGHKLGDAKNIATTAAMGAGLGAAAGGLSTIGSSGNSRFDPNHVNGRVAGGAGIGMAAGAAGALIATLFMRGPDAVLAKGTDVDMVLEQPMRFSDNELPPGSGNQPPVQTTESGLKVRKQP